MMEDLSLPANVRGLAANETFRFSCHAKVACFTDCCRQLELALSPYDVLRLRRALGLTAAEFLERHALVEKTAADIFPQVFLAMVDDGRASCPFVTEHGCAVYQDRPGACRAYPLGRGAYLDEERQPAELFVLLNEPHCCGFEEGPELTVAEWVADQELAVYNTFNDLTIAILQHRRLKEGFRPNAHQQERFITLLYDSAGLSRDNAVSKNITDQELLRSAIRLLQHELFD
jgi:hypothetical protein